MIIELVANQGMTTDCIVISAQEDPVRENDCNATHEIVLRFDGTGPSADENEVRRSPYFAWLCWHKIKAIKATNTAIGMTLYGGCLKEPHSTSGLQNGPPLSS